MWSDVVDRLGRSASTNPKMLPDHGFRLRYGTIFQQDNSTMTLNND